MSNKKPKLCGDWVPLFFTRWRGFLDGKLGAVTLAEDGAHGQYLERVSANCSAYVHAVYLALERDTSSLHKDSAALSVEHENINERLSLPDEQPRTATASILARDAARIAGAKPQLLSRREEVELQLAEIDEKLVEAVSEAATSMHEARARSSRRVHAYLIGVSTALHKSQRFAQYVIETGNQGEEEYLSRHARNDGIRQSILDCTLKEVVSHAV